MFEKKNVVKIEIDSCHLCPNSTLKSVDGEKENLMFCQTNTSCIFLRKGDGVRSIPDWCPKLKQNQPKIMRGLRAKVPGIIEDAIGVQK